MFLQVVALGRWYLAILHNGIGKGDENVRTNVIVKSGKRTYQTEPRLQSLLCSLSASRPAGLPSIILTISTSSSILATSSSYALSLTLTQTPGLGTFTSAIFSLRIAHLRHASCGCGGAASGSSTRDYVGFRVADEVVIYMWASRRAEPG